MGRYRIHLLISCLGGLLLLNACASQGAGTPKLHKASIKDVPAFTQVAFVPQKVITSVARGESATSRTTKGMGTGAVAGTGVGIAAAGHVEQHRLRFFEPTLGMRQLMAPFFPLG